MYPYIYISMLTGLQKEDVIDSFEKRWLQAAFSQFPSLGIHTGEANHLLLRSLCNSEYYMMTIDNIMIDIYNIY